MLSEDLKDIPITDKTLDALGFSEYWDENCDSGTRALSFDIPITVMINNKPYETNKWFCLRDVDEVQETHELCYPGGIVEKHPQYFTTENDYKEIKTLYDIYIELEEDCKILFLELVNKTEL